MGPDRRFGKYETVAILAFDYFCNIKIQGDICQKWRGKDPFEKLQKEIDQPSSVKDELIERNKFIPWIVKTMLRIHEARVDGNIQNARKYTWRFIQRVSLMLVRLNDTYFKRDWGRNFGEIYQLKLLPNDMKTIVDKLLASSDIDEMLLLCTQLLYEARKLTTGEEKTKPISEEPELVIDFSFFFDLVIQINKLRSAHANNNQYAFDFQFISFQDMITPLLEKGIIKDKTLNHLQYTNYIGKDFSSIIEADVLPFLDLLQSELKSYLESRNIEILAYNEIEDFRLC